jgi:hypothetical protein
MADITQNDLSLVEMNKRLVGGMVQSVAERLTKKLRLLEDAVWARSNQEKSNNITVRTYEPIGTMTGINEGADRESSATQQVEEPIGFLESYSRVDKKLTDLAPGNEQFVRQTEDVAFMNGLKKTMGSKLVYANRSTNIREVDGFFTRFNTLAGGQVRGGGGTGNDLMSIVAIKWSIEDGCYLCFPKNSPKGAGLRPEPLGLKLVQDASGKDMQAWVTHWQAEWGICMRDRRAFARYANIETTGSTNIFDDNLLMEMLIEDLVDLDNVVLYTNRRGLSQFTKNANVKTNASYVWSEDGPYAKPTVRFMGIPVKLHEELLVAESAVA